MSEQALEQSPSGGDAQVAELEIGRSGLRAQVKVTPSGLLAIGALVSGILLSTAVLVWVSTSVARRHPLVSRLRP